MGGGFGGGVHAVLRNFVEASRGRLDLVAIEMIEGDSAFANGVAFLDCLGYVGFGQRGGPDREWRRILGRYLACGQGRVRCPRP